MTIEKADRRQNHHSSAKVRKMPPGYNHKELVEDMKKVVRLPMERRLAIAKERRKEQLQWYYAKEMEEKAKMRDCNRIGSGRRNHHKKVQFDSTSLLFSLVSEGDVEGVRSLIASKKCDKDATNCHGVTALHQSCINHNLGMIHVLVKELSADISKPDLELWTPLHTVALLGFADIAKFLLDNGADPLVLNMDMNMPYDICDDTLQTLNIIEMYMVEKGVTQDKIEDLRLTKEFQMLRELQVAFKNDNSLMEKGTNEETLLHVAASLGYREVTRFLLSKTSISIDDVDNDGWQPIHCAAYWNQLNVVEVLMEHGASIFSKTSDDETALDLCRDETMREWMQEKAAHDTQFVKKASCVRRDTRRGSIQDQIGSSHFDSLVSLTDLNKYSHSSKLLNAEMKEAKKKRDVKLEYQSLLTSSTEPPSDCSPSPTSSPPKWFDMSSSPPVFHSFPETPFDIPEGKREVTRSHNNLNDCNSGIRPSSRSQSTSNSSSNNNCKALRPQTSYIAVYKNQLDQYSQLDSPSATSRENLLKHLCTPNESRTPSTPKSAKSTPGSSKDKQIFVFPSESVAINNCENIKKKHIQKDRPSSKKEKSEASVTTRKFQMFLQPNEGQRSQRTGSLTSSKIEAFEIPKRINSFNDVSKFSAVQMSSISDQSKGRSWNKKGEKKGLPNGRCVIS